MYVSAILRQLFSLFTTYYGATYLNDVENSNPWLKASKILDPKKNSTVTENFTILFTFELNAPIMKRCPTVGNISPGPQSYPLSSPTVVIEQKHTS